MSEVIKILDKWGTNMVELARRRLIAAKKVDTGNLINSLDYRISEKGGVYNLQISALPYLQVVNDGRRAGTHIGKYVPIQPLIKWIKKKRIPVITKMKPSVALSKRQNTKVSKEEAIRGMAIAISKNIYKRGYKNPVKPVPIFDLIKKVQNNERFKKELAEAAAKDIAAQLKLKLK